MTATIYLTTATGFKELENEDNSGHKRSWVFDLRTIL
jgi:hypothetical protein